MTPDDLFTPVPARSSDPITSHQACTPKQAEINAKDALLVLELITENPDRTFRELAAVPALRRVTWHPVPDYDQIHKRVSELRRAGKVYSSGQRTCTVSGRSAQTWRASDHA